MALFFILCRTVACIMSLKRYIYGMTFRDMLCERGITIYRLSKDSGIPMTTLEDIATGKKDILDCSGRLLFSISGMLGVSVDDLLSLEKEEAPSTLPEFLQESIREYQTAIRKRSTMVGDMEEQLRSSLNVAEVENMITKEQAQRLRSRFFD